MLMSKKKTTVTLAPTEKIAPGFVIINVSTSSGGLRYIREHLAEDREGARLETEYKTNKVVDHVDVVRELDAKVKEVDYVLRSTCVKTAFGYFATDAKLAEAQKRIDTIKAEMDRLNHKAKILGSAHRGRIGILAARLDIANADTIRECYRAIRETLEGIYEALLRGDVRDTRDKDDNVTARGQLRPALLRARNLESMAVGLAGESIKTALQCAKEARAEIIERIENGASPEEAGRGVDLAPIETAITWFGEGFGGS